MPRQIGVVVLGDGTRFKSRMVRDERQAQRLAYNWKQQSKKGGGQEYNATLVAVYDDGTVQNNNQTAKTWLRQQPKQTLIRPGIRLETMQKVKAP